MRITFVLILVSALLFAEPSGAQTAILVPRDQVDEHTFDLARASGTKPINFDPHFALVAPAITDQHLNLDADGILAEYGAGAHLVAGPRTVLGDASTEGSPDFAHHIEDLRASGINARPVIVFPPGALASALNHTLATQTSNLNLQIFGHDFKVTNVVMDPQISATAEPGAHYLLHLGGARAEARLTEAPIDPTNPNSPRVLHGDIVVGNDLYRVVPYDAFGRSSLQRVENAVSNRDHSDHSIDSLFALSPTRACAARPRNTIRIGWAISTDALKALQPANGPSIFTVTPSQISEPIRHLNAMLQNNGISGIHFEAFPLIVAGQTWGGGVSTPDGVWALATSGYPDFAEVRSQAAKQDADIVLLIVDSAKDYCGRSTLFANADTAFSVVNQRCMFSPRYALPHEIGHILGGCHEPAFYQPPDFCGPNAPHTPGDRFAWRSNAAARGDMMSTWAAPDPNDDNGFVREAHFSSAADATGPSPKPGALVSMNVVAILQSRLAEVSTFGRCRSPTYIAG